MITKKQKIDEAVEIKEIKEETDSDYLKIGKFLIVFPFYLLHFVNLGLGFRFFALGFSLLCSVSV